MWGGSKDLHFSGVEPSQAHQWLLQTIASQGGNLRLNFDIPRLATYMRNEEAYLHVKEEQVRSTNPALVHQIQLHRMEKSGYIEHHTAVLNDRGIGGLVSIHILSTSSFALHTYMLMQDVTTPQSWGPKGTVP
jgi:hypothetical protein